MNSTGNIPAKTKPAFRYYWLLMRPTNLGIILLTMTLFMFHAAAWNIKDIRWPESLTVILAVLFVAAGGYVINDIFDIEEDIINKPEKRIIAKHLSVRSGNLFYAFLLISSLIAGFATGWAMGLLCIVMNVLLYFYASDLKGSNLWGNLLVSFMNGMVVFTSGWGALKIFNGYFAEYALMAFLITLAREIVKDMEDIEGDRAQEYETFPIAYGMNKAVWLGMSVLTALNVLILLIMVLAGSLWFNLYMIAAVILPVFYFYYSLLSAGEKADYSRLQKQMKLLMVTGLLSVVLI
jgi:4-hydroxybenzoate polyprenyltransferase